MAALAGGCRFSPIPIKIDEYYRAAHECYPKVNDVLEVGDLVFRKGHFFICNGPVDYSSFLSHWCESPFSHIGMVYQKVGDTWVILNTDAHGIKRTFLIDWLIEGPENIVVKRLKPEHRDKIPLIIKEAGKLLDRDVLHDAHYLAETERFYCTEIMDYCFREAGLPLAPLIRIRDLPKIGHWYTLPWYHIVGLVAEIDLDNAISVCGNESYGMYSSPALMEVLNLLPDEYRQPPYALSD